LQAARAPADLVLNLGDAFYPYGIADGADPQWNTTFEDIYSAPGLQVPWYGVLGNHDWHRNASAMATTRGRWKIPALSHVVRGLAAGVPLTIIFIDTNMVMASDICKHRNQSDWGPLSIDDFEGCKQEIEDVFEPQVEWLERRLRSAAGSVKIVVGHHPVYYTGKWASEGDNAPDGLEERLAPLFQHHGVHAYLSGHDHVLQHFMANGTDYYIVGTGGGELEDHPYDFETRAQVRRTQAGFFGYGMLEVGSTDICMRFFVNENSVASYGHCRAHGITAEYSV
jgi:acid phosphatase